MMTRQVYELFNTWITELRRMLDDASAGRPVKTDAELKAELDQELRDQVLFEYLETTGIL